MKKLYLLILVLFPVMSFAAGKWQVQNPLPTESWLKTIEPVTDEIIFAGGLGGTLMKSTNGGETWETKKFQEFFDIKSIYFSDVLTGWFTSNKKIFRTNDGGNTWQNSALDFDLTPYYLMNISGFEKSIYLFLHPKTAAIWELPFATSVILKSTDNGDTWQSLDVEIKGKMLCNSFVNDSCGFFYTEETISIDTCYYYFYKTTDGGETWNKKRFPQQFWTLAMKFINEQVGFVGRYRTANSGDSWENVFDDLLDEYESINAYHFTDSLNGWAVSGQAIFNTTDGGLSWQKLDNIAHQQLIDISFSKNGEGWIVGWAGDLFYKNKNSDEWQSKSTGPREDLIDVCFVNEREGWCVGDDGIVLHTHDSGAIWEQQTSGTRNILRRVRFLNEQTGWIVGDSVIMQTLNAGATWVDKTFLKAQFTDIDFFDENNGLLIENSGNLYRTGNGGNDWEMINDQIFSGKLSSLAIVDENEAWLGGIQGLAHTTDKGETINWYDIPNLKGVVAIQFVNKLEGSLINNMGDIFNTQNGGLDWVAYPKGTNMELDPVTAFFMLDRENYILYEGFTSGYLKTARLNSEWTADVAEDYGAIDIRGIYFVNQNLGWAAGNAGTILKYAGESTGIFNTQATTTEPVKKNERIHISPNPFHPAGARITFQLQNTQNVTARVYNLLGQQVADLYNGYLNSGVRELAWRPGSLASGIYFISIECDEFTVCKKCIYIKE